MRIIINCLTNASEGLLFSFQGLLPRKLRSRNSPFAFVILHISLTCVYRFDGKLLLLILFLIMQSKFGLHPTNSDKRQ